MVTSLVLFSLSQSISMWDRAERQLKKLDNIVFLNHWLKELFHSAQRLTVTYHEMSIPLFVGDSRKVIFITTNPLQQKVMALIKMEFRENALLYSEFMLYKAGLEFQDLSKVQFPEEFELMTDVSDGRFSYFYKNGNLADWMESYDSEQTGGIPQVFRVELIHKDKPIRITANLLVTEDPRWLFRKVDYL